MKPCSNCNVTGTRNWEGNAPGNHPCRICSGDGNVPDQSDVPDLATGWLGTSGKWYTASGRSFDMQQIMALVLGK